VFLKRRKTTFEGEKKAKENKGENEEKELEKEKKIEEKELEIKEKELEIKEKEKKIEEISKRIGEELMGQNRSSLLDYLNRQESRLNEEKSRLIDFSNGLQRDKTRLIKEIEMLRSQSSLKPGKSIPSFQWDPESEDFPYDGPGQVLFQRRIQDNQSFFKQQADFILERKGSHYYRGAPGSGKTVFLKMLGKELQDRGCLVYFISNAGELVEHAREEYIQLSKLGKVQTVVILVDEVHKAPNSPRWTPLLRELKKDLIVIGVGIKRVGITDPSPDFRVKHPATEMLLTQADLPQLIEHWSGERHPEEVVHPVCECLLEFTGGHLYPFTHLAEYLFNQDQVSLLSMKDILQHLRSDEFSTHEVMVNIKRRCFEGTTHVPLLTAARKVFLLDVFKGSDFRELVEPLEAMAFWDNKANWFISDLLTCHLYTLVTKEDTNKDAIFVDEKNDWESTAEDLVIHGLTNMEQKDFEDPTSANFRFENGLGILWGYHVGCAFKNLYASPQTQVSHHSPSTVDWYFDSRLNMAVELIRNGRPGGLQERHGLNSKFQKFSKGGLYSQWERYIVLNFEMEKKDPTMPTIEYNPDRLYTFVFQTNSLYRGKVLIKNNVVRALGVPHQG